MLAQTHRGFMENADVLVDRAIALRPLLKAHAAEHEKMGELSEDVIDALDQADLFRMAAPRRNGGLCVAANVMARVAIELARGCPSTAWVVSVVNSNIWLASTATTAMQNRIFRNGVPRITGPGYGRGTIRREGGRHVVNGSWGYGSASHHAEWAMVYADDEDGCLNRIAIPMASLELEHSWQVAGMRATGSDTVVARDVAVEDDQFYRIAAVGTNTGGAIDDDSLEPTDYWAFPVHRAKSFGVLVGCAQGLLDTVVETRERPVVNSAITRRGDSAVWQARLGQAAAEIGVARLTMDAHTRFNDACALEGRAMTMEERSALRGEHAVVTDMLVATVERLMNLVGSSGYMDRNPAQRFWRDFSIAIRHGVYNTDVSYEAHGKHLLGVTPNILLDAHV